jgi:hypothetical protein
MICPPGFFKRRLIYSWRPGGKNSDPGEISAAKRLDVVSAV